MVMAFNVSSCFMKSWYGFYKQMPAKGIMDDMVNTLSSLTNSPVI